MEVAEDVVEQAPGLLRVNLPEVGGEYELTCSPVLVQAVGSSSGVDFYFRAKYGEWEFETEDEAGHPFPVGDSRRFVRRGSFNAAKPGVMSLEWAACILRRCLSEWCGVGAKPNDSAGGGAEAGC